jgi:hypothetical protein
MVFTKEQLRGQEGIRGVLNQFGGCRVGDDHGCSRRREQFGDGFARPGRTQPTTHALGRKGVAPAVPSRRNSGFETTLIDRAQYVADAFHPHGHRGLVDHDRVITERVLDLARHGVNEREVGSTVVAHRCRHTEKDEIGARDGFVGVGDNL